jgi:hypothetical protein
MPFTFSHPAIVLPGVYLPRKWRSVTGLVVGSVAPDFEMFLRMEAENRFSHTWHSMFWFSLPLAVALAFLFHKVVRNPLIDHLPRFLRQRLSGFKRFDWSDYFKEHALVVIVSIVVGTASHICWDSLTHRYGIFIKWFPVLATELAIGQYQTPLYHWLQLGFSVIGGLVVLYAILQLPAETIGKQNRAGLKYWLLVSAIALVIAAIRINTGLDTSYFPNLIVVVISGGLAGLLVTPVLLKERQQEEQ